MLRTVISARSIAVTFRMCFLMGGVQGRERTRCPRAWARRGTGGLYHSSLLDGCSVEGRFSFNVHFEFASRSIAPDPWNGFSQDLPVCGIQHEPRLIKVVQAKAG